MCCARVGGAMSRLIKKIAGFTLVEVLIALTIVSIALLSLVIAVTNYTYQQNNIKETTVATWIARDCINKVKLGIEDASQGQVSMLSGQYQWRMQRSTTPDVHTDKLIVTVLNQQNVTLISLTGFMAKVA